MTAALLRFVFLRLSCVLSVAFPSPSAPASLTTPSLQPPIITTSPSLRPPTSSGSQPFSTSPSLCSKSFTLNFFRDLWSSSNLLTACWYWWSRRTSNGNAAETSIKVEIFIQQHNVAPQSWMRTVVKLQWIQIRRSQSAQLAVMSLKNVFATPQRIEQCQNGCHNFSALDWLHARTCKSLLLISPTDHCSSACLKLRYRRVNRIFRESSLCTAQSVRYEVFRWNIYPLLYCYIPLLLNVSVRYHVHRRSLLFLQNFLTLSFLNFFPKILNIKSILNIDSSKSISTSWHRSTFF